MTKHQIYVEYQDDYSASTKAQQDVRDILSGLSYETKKIVIKRSKNKVTNFLNYNGSILKGWSDIFSEIDEGDVVFWQGPNEYTNETGRKYLRYLKSRKKVHLIALLHDIDELRMDDSRYLRDSRSQHDVIIELADAIIVHTDAMREWLISKGCVANKIIVLDLFDYLCLSDRNNQPTYIPGKEIIIAGNLNTNKCGYLRSIKQLDGVHFTLYGPNFSKDILADNTEYYGSLSPNELVNELNTGFGLVWDGAMIDSCGGKGGEYLRYNSPHKLSLYLTAGLPVIVWAQSAQAELVRNNRIGICVDSLTDLKAVMDSISADEIREMSENAQIISEKLKKGYYTSRAIAQAEAGIMKK